MFFEKLQEVHCLISDGPQFLHALVQIRSFVRRPSKSDLCEKGKENATKTNEVKER